MLHTGRSGAAMKMAALLVSGIPALVHSHGMMTVPAARNIDDNCGHCLSGGGPGAVNANGGYLHGMCGNSGTDADQNWNAASASPQLIGQSGDSFPVEIVVTAHHHGFFEFELCDSPDITEECFRATRLYRSGCDPAVEGEEACRRWWKVLNSNELGSYSLQPQGYPDGAPYVDAGSCGVVAYTAFYDIPADVSCTHCVLRWHWYTTNSCTSPTATSEEFWNCADVRINAPDGHATADTSADDLVALNARLTSTLPSDLSALQTDNDYWACPLPAYGLPGEYSCSVDGSDDDTSGCVAESATQTCVIKFHGEDGGGAPVPTTTQGNGGWGSTATTTGHGSVPTSPTTAAGPTSTTAAAETGTGYCTWGECNGAVGSEWCDATQDRCEGACEGVWCPQRDVTHTTAKVEATTTTAAGGTTTTVATTTTAAATTTVPGQTTVTTAESAATSTGLGHAAALVAIAALELKVDALTGLVADLAAAFSASSCAGMRR